MSKPTIESTIISRALNASSSLKFISMYNVDDECVKTCMRKYDNRPIIYLLVSNGVCLYVGKTKAQYSRFLSHNSNINFTNIFLFECSNDDLSNAEKSVIEEFKPLYNVDHNPLAKRYKTILDLDYALLTKEGKLERDLELYDQYSKGSLFGFNLNPAIFNVLKKKADENKCTCSEMLQTILESLYPEEISNELKSDSGFPHTNLVTTIEYAEMHGTIRESIKQFLNANPDRIPGALKLGRDWILPADSPYPSDKRKKA